VSKVVCGAHLCLLAIRNTRLSFAVNGALVASQWQRRASTVPFNRCCCGGDVSQKKKVITFGPKAPSPAQPMKSTITSTTDEKHHHQHNR